MFTFRDTIRRICPPWLRHGTAERILYAIAIQLDALVDSVVAAIEIRFPGVYSGESLPLLGRDRRIRRGPSDTDETYAARLIGWRDAHRRKGNPYALLEQLHAYYAPNNFPIQLVNVSGARYSLAVDGTITRDAIEWTPGGGPPEKWARWWLFYEWPAAVGDDGLWGDPGDWGDGGVWGTDMTVEEADDLRAVPIEWNAAHCFGHVVLLQAGAELWGYPPELWGAPGVWGSTSVVQIPIR